MNKRVCGAVDDDIGADRSAGPPTYGTTAAVAIASTAGLHL